MKRAQSATELERKPSTETCGRFSIAGPRCRLLLHWDRPMEEVLAAARRIWIFGSSCAGKTTLAARMAESRGLDHIPLDALFWQPGWTEGDREKLARDVDARMQSAEAAGTGWIVDGNYTGTRQRFADRIELCIWLDLPRRVLVPRLVQRTLGRSWTRERVCGDNVERWWSLLHPRESLLFYTLRSFARHRREAAEFVRGRTHLRLRSRRDVAAFTQAQGL